MKALTLCKKCQRPLVAHEEIHAVKGQLYCSKSCAVYDIMDEYIMNAHELATEDYASMAEIVRAEDVLSEDLQTVEVIVTCRKYIKLPADLTEEKAIREARQLYDDGLVVAEPGDCDEILVVCKLVKEDNSKHVMEG